jgi:hypothetical protein
MSKERAARIQALVERYDQAPPELQRLASAVLLQSVVRGLLTLAARAQASALDVDIIDGECHVTGDSDA